MESIFRKGALSTGGLPILSEKEYVVCMEKNVSVEMESKRIICREGAIVLSNLCLYVIAFEIENKTCFNLLLEHIKSVSDCASFFKSSKRIKLTVNDSRSTTTINDVFLRFEDGKEQFLLKLRQIIQKEPWKEFTIKSAPDFLQPNETIPDKIVHEKVGLEAIIHRQQSSQTKEQNIAKASLDDIDSLMQHAKQVITLINNYSTIVQKTEEKTSISTPDEINPDFKAERGEMENIMRNIGMLSTVSRDAAGGFYFNQLAGQIADILLSETRLQRLGGLITLTDLYSMYNRARGTDLLSPDDLLIACRTLNSLKLGIKLHRFQSGVYAVRLDLLDEESLCRSLIGLLGTRLEKGISASDVTQTLKISITIAKELLLLAESRGELCRDETVHGIYFFENRFR